MLMPKKVKYRKQQRGRMAGKAWRGSDVSFGDYGLKALEPCWMTARQIEAARVAMTRFDQARRQDLDPRVPGQADHQEAAGNAHGQGQGRARRMGVRGPARTHPVRDGRGQRDRRARGDAAGRGQAPDQDEVRDPVRARRRRHEGDGMPRPRRSTSCGSARRTWTTSCSGCASRSRWGSWRPRTS